MITDFVQTGLREMRMQAHSNCVVCSPANSRSLCLTFTASDDGRVQACFDCDGCFEGYAGMLHGGVIVSLLDGAMTNCMFAHGGPGRNGGTECPFSPFCGHQPHRDRARLDRAIIASTPRAEGGASAG